MAAIADSFSVCLMTTMDRLWFHQTILIQTDPLAIAPLSDKRVSSETSSDSLPQLPQTQTSSASLPTTTPHQEEAERPTRLPRLETKRPRSQSSSPCTQRRHRLKSLKYSSSSSLSGTKLEKTASCKTLRELELEEVKGFMDLGFVFKKEDLSSRMVSLVPGLQRIGSPEYKNKLHIDIDDEDIATEERGFDDDDVKERGVMRPYLSEAWLIKRPDPPLLNLRVPKILYDSCNDVVMKKHIRFWAKTVALVMRQES